MNDKINFQIINAIKDLIESDDSPPSDRLILRFVKDDKINDFLILICGESIQSIIDKKALMIN